jgi:hypothetical protein
MSSSQPKQFNIESLILALAILIGFIGATIIFSMLQSGQILYYFLAIASAIVISYAIFIGIRRRKTFHFAVGLALAGMIIVSLALVPYTRTETVRYDASGNMTPYFWSSGERAASLNGTLAIISLQPNSSKTYHYDGDLGSGQAINASIVQIDISTIGLLELQIGDYSLDNAPPDDVYFSTHAYGQRTILWTPIDKYNRQPAFLFRNLGTQPIDFTFNVTIFLLKHLDYVQTSQYLSTSQTYYIVIGILLISLGVILNVFLHFRQNSAR